MSDARKTLTDLIPSRDLMLVFIHFTKHRSLRARDILRSFSFCENALTAHLRELTAMGILRVLGTEYSLTDFGKEVVLAFHALDRELRRRSEARRASLDTMASCRIKAVRIYTHSESSESTGDAGLIEKSPESTISVDTLRAAETLEQFISDLQGAGAGLNIMGTSIPELAVNASRPIEKGITPSSSIPTAIIAKRA